MLYWNTSRSDSSTAEAVAVWAALFLNIYYRGFIYIVCAVSYRRMAGCR